MTKSIYPNKNRSYCHIMGNDTSLVSSNIVHSNILNFYNPKAMNKVSVHCILREINTVV